MAGPTAGGTFGGPGGFAGDLRDFADLGGARTGYGGGLGAGSGRQAPGRRTPTGRAEPAVTQLARAGGGPDRRRAWRAGQQAADRLPGSSSGRRDLAGRRAGVLGGRGRHPADGRRTGDGHGRVHRQRSRADRRPARAVRPAGQAALRNDRRPGRLRRRRRRRGGGGGGGGGTVASVISWVEHSCTAVPASAYGGSATSASASVAARAVAPTVAETLYHCG